MTGQASDSAISSPAERTGETSPPAASPARSAAISRVPSSSPARAPNAASMAAGTRLSASKLPAAAAPGWWPSVA
ncbi:MAG TPA: hypothetical protein VHU92_03495 [Streptosporangiaceae bacterium]|nr:hypothetical protein [Streptosporangiaceae bacterium]